MQNFTIRSVSSDRSLNFSNLNGDYLQVDLQGFNISARAEINIFTNAFNTDAFGLNKFFQELATNYKPWSGIKKWKSLEGEFSLSATCSTLGQVLFRIDIRILPGHPEESSISTGILSELGQLLSISKEAERFFRSSS